MGNPTPSDDEGVKYSYKKMFAKAFAGTANAGVSMTISKWMADTLLAWIEWFNHQPSYKVIITLPEGYKTAGTLGLVIFAALTIAQDRLRYHGYWPKILD